MLMFQPVGGMDQIPRALSKAIGGHRIRLGAEVTGVTDKGQAVEVTYRQGGREKLVKADFCVAALPPHLMARVPHNLGADVTTAAGKLSGDRVRQDRSGISAPLVGARRPDLRRHHRDRPRRDTHLVPVLRLPRERGLVVGYYNTGATAQAYSALTPAERETRAVAQGVKIHGEKYRSELATSFSRPGTARRTWKAPGRPRPTERPATACCWRPAGRVYFAGDWLSHEVAWQHGAFMSARSVVTALHQRVMST